MDAAMTPTTQTARPARPATARADATRRTRDLVQDPITAGHDALVTGSNMAIAEVALDRARLRRGVRVLDVACGTGALSIPAARRGGQVLAVDRAPGTIEELDARARQEGLPLEARAMQGHGLDLGDDAVDLTASQFGITGFPDPLHGLDEMVRVTRPGGEVLTVVTGPPAEMEGLGVLLDAVRTAVPGVGGLPMDAAPRPHRLSDPDVLARSLARAGLGDVRVEASAHAIEFRSAAHLWDWVTSTDPIAARLAVGLTGEERDAALMTVEYHLLDRSNGHGTVVLDNVVYTGIGTKRRDVGGPSMHDHRHDGGTGTQDGRTVTAQRIPQGGL